MPQVYLSNERYQIFRARLVDAIKIVDGRSLSPDELTKLTTAMLRTTQEEQGTSGVVSLPDDRVPSNEREARGAQYTEALETFGFEFISEEILELASPTGDDEFEPFSWLYNSGYKHISWPRHKGMLKCVAASQTMKKLIRLIQTAIQDEKGYAERWSYYHYRDQIVSYLFFLDDLIKNVDHPAWIAIALSSIRVTVKNVEIPSLCDALDSGDFDVVWQNIEALSETDIAIIAHVFMQNGASLIARNGHLHGRFDETENDALGGLTKLTPWSPRDGRFRYIDFFDERIYMDGPWHKFYSLAEYDDCQIDGFCPVTDDEREAFPEWYYFLPSYASDAGGLFKRLISDPTISDLVPTSEFASLNTKDQHGGAVILATPGEDKPTILGSYKVTHTANPDSHDASHTVTVSDLRLTTTDTSAHSCAIIAAIHMDLEHMAEEWYRSVPIHTEVKLHINLLKLDDAFATRLSDALGMFIENNEESRPGLTFVPIIRLNGKRFRTDSSGGKTIRR
ncbi:hypothetical protein [Rhizobium sp. MHM7A]|uniref:hypothetical protein n=1 Tax=Rhizobium sp. MHM7A TaxID=2583233 RepID=UPI00110693FB|nr:hypothetical protein [Rhizobium sp. MHM7A]TLX16019.1 hypothetical protein FFR93_01490 [Rhizobium sp. MHM7A]